MMKKGSVISVKYTQPSVPNNYLTYKLDYR